MPTLMREQVNSSTKRMPLPSVKQLLSNLKQNWFLPISATAFFSLYDDWTVEYRLGVMVAFFVWVVISALSASLFSEIKHRNIVRHLFSFMTAAGICWRARDVFCSARNDLPTMQLFGGLLPEPLGNVWFLSAVGALVGLYFVYVCVSLLEKRLVEIVDECRLFEGIHWAEATFYGVLISLSIGFVAVCFLRSEAFYGTEYLYDIVFTSDSPDLLKGNAYLTLTHPENDLRQPLFAVFSAPFLGMPYLIGKAFRASETVQAILLGAMHVAILFFANFMLAKMMRLRSVGRACFMTLACSTYTYMLFILMLEQYVVAFFWLVFCLYSISEKRPCERIALWGAGGTLLPGMVLLPFASSRNPCRQLKEWMVDVGTVCAGFVVLLLAFCRSDVLRTSTDQLHELNRFQGESLSWIAKIHQYVAFVANCMLAPDAGENVASFNHVSWQLNPVVHMNSLGVLLFCGAICSVALNWRKRSCRIAAGWVCFSVLILLVWGWGTQENGLILYSLYFGWAYLVLLFQLVERIGEYSKIRMFVPIVSIACAALLGVINIPAIMALVRFAIANYPT